jgi:uncharacterized protein YxjI
MNYNKLTIKQEKEMMEVFTGFETKNRYQVFFNKEPVGFAGEQSDSMSRFFMPANRPLKLSVIDKQKNNILTIDRKWFFFFPKYQIYNSDKTYLGKIKTRFSFAKKVFDILDSNNRLIYKCKTEVMHPWTLRVFQGQREMARVTKKWGGMGREMFTDADTIEVNFGMTPDENMRKLILGLGFALDLTFFERHGNK